MRRPKLRSVKSATARRTTTATPMPMITRTVSESPSRNDQNAAPSPSTTIANRSKTRSMKIVPNVADSDTGKLIFRSQAR